MRPNARFAHLSGLNVTSILYCSTIFIFIFFEILSPDTDSKMKLNDNGFNEQKNQLNKQILRSEVLEPKHINMVDELQPEDTSDYLFFPCSKQKIKLLPF